MKTATASAPQRQFRSNKPGFQTPVRRKYFLMWKKACEVHGWKPSDDAKRHALTFRTFGRRVSSNDFSPAHWDEIFNALELLIDDLNLAAVIERIALDEFAADKATHKPKVVPGKRNPGRKTASVYENIPRADHPGERKRLEYFISRLFMPSYIRKVVVDRWGVADWTTLSIPQLTDLRDLLRNRLSKWLTTAKLKPELHSLPQGVPVAPNSRTGNPTNEAYIKALLDRGSPVDLRDRTSDVRNGQDGAGEGDPF